MTKQYNHDIETRDKRQETRDKRQETRDKRQETRVEVYVAAHKKIDFELPDYCKRIQVNAERNGQWEGYLHDNDNPDNISLKNPNYSELTALYAMWKNCDADIQGLYHYRRYISNVDVLQETNDVIRGKNKNTYKGLRGMAISCKEVKEICITEQAIIDELKHADVICRHPVDLYPFRVTEFYRKWCYWQDINEMCRLIKEEYPDYYPATVYMNEHSVFCSCNVFIARREFVNDYCTWLFDVLAKMEKRVSLEGYNVQHQRLYGYLAEFLLNIYIITHKLKCRYFYAGFITDMGKPSLKTEIKQKIIKRLKQIPKLVKLVRAVRERLHGHRQNEYFNISVTRMTRSEVIVLFTAGNSDIFYVCGIDSLVESVKESVQKLEAEFSREGAAVMPRIALRSGTPDSIKRAFIESGVSVIEYD